MDAFLLEYLPIVIFLGISSAIGIVFILASALLAPKAPDPEKLSTYECGFNAFDDARMKFDVRFYLVSILFIIFEPLGLYGRWLKVRTWFELFPFYRKGMFRRQKSYMKSERLK